MIVKCGRWRYSAVVDGENFPYQERRDENQQFCNVCRNVWNGSFPGVIISVVKVEKRYFIVK